MIDIATIERLDDKARVVLFAFAFVQGDMSLLDVCKVTGLADTLLRGEKDVSATGQRLCEKRILRSERNRCTGLTRYELLVSAFARPSQTRAAKYIRVFCPNANYKFNDRSDGERRVVSDRNQVFHSFLEIVSGYRMKDSLEGKEDWFMGNLAEPVWALLGGMDKDRSAGRSFSCVTSWRKNAAQRKSKRLLPTARHGARDGRTWRLTIRRVAAFQRGEGDLFLMSLKAGGTGINLTAANYVVLLDPWWNPAVEEQAADRAHRIGQRNPVTVYRLIAADTVEERVLELHREKKELARDVLDGTGSSALTPEALMKLFG